MHPTAASASRPVAASAPRPTATSTSRSAAPRVALCCSQRIAPYCSSRVAPYCLAQRAPCCPIHRTPCPAARGAPCLAEPRRTARAALPNPSRTALPRSPAPPSRPAATAAAAATARATAAAGGGAVGSAAGAGGTGGATGSAGGDAGAGGAGPTTDRHYLSWPLSRQLQRLGVDSDGHCLSQTTPPLSIFASGFFSKPVQVVEALVFYVQHRGGSRAAALGASESAAALGASESAADLGARASPTIDSSAVALHTFTLDSGASRCFFLARASTVLSCPAVPSGSLSGLHLPTFSTNLVSNAAIQDVWVDTFIPVGQRVAICTLYTLTTASAEVDEAGQVAASSQVSTSGQLAASCSCRVLSHQNLLLHRRLGHPSLPRLCSMHSRPLVSGLPRSLPSLPRLPAPPCLPCVEGRQHAAPHSSEFPPTTTPLQTLHMDVRGPAPVGGTDQERYFLLVVDHYTRYTTVFPLRRKADVSETSPTLRWTGKAGDASVFRVWGALSLIHDAKASKLSSRTLRCVFLGFPTDVLPWQFYQPRSRRVFSSQDVTFDDSDCFYKLHPHASYRVPLAPLFFLPVPPQVDPLPPQGPAPSSVSQVDPPPLVEPLEISSDSSGPAEGGDPTADDTAATRCSPRFETPPGFSPRPSSPPPQPAAVDPGAETAGAEPGVAETEGEGSGGAETGGAVTGGAAIGGAGSGGVATGGAGSWGAATGA
ncbi:unnamed protein product [Closterium sp. NIES-54]